MSKPIYRVGEDVRLKVHAPVDNYLYCYLQDNAGKIQRIFPNRFASDARVSSPLPIDLPGAMGFVFKAESSGTPEKVGCVGTRQDVSGALPPPLRIADFERIGAASLEEIATMFTKAAGAEVTLATATVEVNRTN